eukprot:COSAG06_NODE_16319_length_1007_cov_1.787445_2_plen_238_part_00
MFDMQAMPWPFEPGRSPESSEAIVEPAPHLFRTVKSRTYGTRRQQWLVYLSVRQFGFSLLRRVVRCGCTQQSACVRVYTLYHAPERVPAHIVAPHLSEGDDVDALPRVLLGYLRLHHYIRLLQPAEQRVKRLPHLNNRCVFLCSQAKDQSTRLAFVSSLSRQIIDCFPDRLLCRDIHQQHRCPPQRQEEKKEQERSSHLKVHRSVFDLYNNILIKSSIKRHERIERLTGEVLSRYLT